VVLELVIGVGALRRRRWSRRRSGRRPAACP
jgi:hypothetical protein